MFPLAREGMLRCRGKPGHGVENSIVRMRNVQKRGAEVGRDGMASDLNSLSFTAQDRNLLQLLAGNLHGFDLHIIAHTKFVDGDELIPALQPGPRLDG
jgi:hypothetical protein